MNGIIGKKVGMTSIYDDAGNNLACTVVEACDNYITQVKTEESDGYYAVQLGFDESKPKNTTNPELGHFKKAGVAPQRKVKEFRNMETDKSLGDALSIGDVFNEGDYVNVIGVSKGKGFQGVVKRHGFSGVGDKTHGQGDQERAGGSVGASSDPSRVFKGMRMPGRTGGDRTKIRNLQVIKMLKEKNLLIIKGAIPGHKGSYVIVEK